MHRSWFHMRGRRAWLAWSAAIIAILGASGMAVAWVQAGQRLGPHDAGGGGGTYWTMPETRFSQPLTVSTDARMFAIGDAVIMPNGLKLQVTHVERNWQPATAQSALGKMPSGDNPAGREVVLVWFVATDVGTSPILYNDFYFR